MANTVEILGVFDRGEKVAACAQVILGNGLGEVVAYSPVPDHAIDQALHVEISPIRVFVLLGGLVGCATGFIFPIYTVLEWPLITGGKPLISIPAFVVIAFELTILFAAISGMAGFLWMTGLPRLTGRPAPDARFTGEMSGLSVTCTPDHAADVRACLEGGGAIEVRE